MTPTIRITMKRILSLVVVTVLVMSSLFIKVKPVQAVTYTLTVDFLGDDPTKTACISVLANDCSLRGAIMHVNADPTIPKPEYHIVLAGATYTLTNHGTNEDGNVTGDLDINYSGVLIIEGAGGLISIINGEHADRVIEVHSGTLKLSMLSVRSGTASGSSENGGGIFLQPFSALELYGVDVSDNIAYFNGGGIYSDHASVLFYICSVRDNQAYNHGGGAYVDSAALIILGVTFENNHNDIGDGGGLTIVGGSNAIISASLYKDNSASASGGGIKNDSDGNLQIFDSGFINNSAIDGAAIQTTGAFSMERAFVTGNVSQLGATMTFGNSNFSLTDVTIVNNTSAGFSAILYAGDGYTGTLDHVTIVGNQSTGSFASITVFAGSVVLMNSIINNNDGNDGNDACGFNSPISEVISADYNIAGDESCNLTQPHDHPSTDPQLATPGYYGGMLIAAPLGGSITIDNANPTFLPGDIDQRGAIREDGDLNGSILPDIGAAEFLTTKQYLPVIINP